MRFLETRNWVVSTLSPVHVGCGEDYVPTEYVVDHAGVLHHFDVGQLAALSDTDIAAAISTALTKESAEEQLREVHKTLNKYRDRIIPLADTHVAMCAGVHSHYRQTQDARNDFNRNGIERSSYQPLSQLPYLPGSSIKGAIRTALLNDVAMNRNPLERQVRERIAQFNAMIEEFDMANGRRGLRLKGQYSKRDYTTALKDIEKEIARSAARIGVEWFGGSFECDPLRAIKIGDGVATGNDIEREIFFCLNRSRSGRRTQAQSKGLYTRLEYVREHQPGVIQLPVTVQDLTAVAGAKNQRGQMIAPAQHSLVNWQRVVEACERYYLPRLKNDLGLVMKLQPASAWAKQTKTLLEAGLMNDIEAHRVLLLRVGKHGGADSNTVDGRQIKVKLSEDKRSLRDGRSETIPLYSFDDEPRTTWFCGDDLDHPSDLLPHGWIVVSENDLPWHLQMPGHERRERRRFLALESARRQAETQAAEQAEAVARAAREAARAVMTANRQRVEDFRDFCTRRAGELMTNKERANESVHNSARVLAKAAHEETGWTGEERCAAADAIEEWLPKLVRIEIKDERKKLKLAALRT